MTICCKNFFQKAGCMKTNKIFSSFKSVNSDSDLDPAKRRLGPDTNLTRYELDRIRICQPCQIIQTC